MMCQRMGRCPTSTSGLGRNSVSSRSRVPWPPHRITTFISQPRVVWVSIERICGRSGLRGFQIEPASRTRRWWFGHQKRAGAAVRHPFLHGGQLRPRPFILPLRRVGSRRPNSSLANRRCAPQCSTEEQFYERIACSINRVGLSGRRPFRGNRPGDRQPVQGFLAFRPCQVNSEPTMT